LEKNDERNRKQKQINRNNERQSIWADSIRALTFKYTLQSGATGNKLLSAMMMMVAEMVLAKVEFWIIHFLSKI